MATVASELRALVSADVRKFKQGMNEVRRESKRAGKESAAAFAQSKLALMAVAAAAIALGRAMFMAVKATADAAGKAEETRNRFTSTFRAWTAETDLWITDHMTSLGYARSQWEDWLAQIQDTLVPLGYMRGEAAGTSREIAQLAVDLGSFKDQAPEEAMSAITSGIVGMHRALLKYGIVIDENKITQEAWNMGLEKSYDELTAQEKVQARINIIMQSTKDAQGDLARTGGSWVNVIRKLSGSWKGLREEMGRIVSESPKAKGFLSGLTKGFQDWTTSLELSRKELEILREAYPEMIAEMEAANQRAQMSGEKLVGFLRSMDLTVKANLHAIAAMGTSLTLGDEDLANEHVKGFWANLGEAWKAKAGTEEGQYARWINEANRRSMARLAAMKEEKRREEMAAEEARLLAEEEAEKERQLLREAQLEVEKTLDEQSEAFKRYYAEIEADTAESYKTQVREVKERVKEEIEEKRRAASVCKDLLREVERAVEDHENKIRDLKKATIEAERGFAEKAFGFRQSQMSEAASGLEEQGRRAADAFRAQAEREHRLRGMSPEQRRKYLQEEQRRQSIEGRAGAIEAGYKRRADAIRQQAEAEKRMFAQQIAGTARSAREAGDFDDALDLAEKAMDYYEQMGDMGGTQAAQQFILETIQQQTTAEEGLMEARKQQLENVKTMYEEFAALVQREYDLNINTGTAEENLRRTLELASQVGTALEGSDQTMPAPTAPETQEKAEPEGPTTEQGAPEPKAGAAGAAGGGAASFDIKVEGDITRETVRDKVMPYVLQQLDRWWKQKMGGKGQEAA
jgi:hypothetical protein